MKPLSKVISLPKRTGGRPPQELPPSTRCLTVIGANGAGKSRFAARLVAEMGPEAWRVSALNAIYGGARTPSALTKAYTERLQESPMMRADLTTEFEQMMALILDREMDSMLSERYAVPQADGAEHPRPEKTPLQILAELWRELFPDSSLAMVKGSLQFTNRSSADAIGAQRLSDGEKAVIYYLGAALLAPRDAVMIVENPGMFLHPSMMSRLWNRIESMRRQGRIIYVTHDLDFASDRANARGGAVVWVKHYDADTDLCDYEVLPPGSGLTDELSLALMGSRKPVMFIEGDGVNSIDAKLYPLVFKDFTVRSLGGCDRVIEATRTFNDLRALHNLNSVGLVDRDRRSDKEVEYLRKRGIMVPDVAEVENLLMLPDVIRTVAAHYGHNPDGSFAHVRRNIMRLFASDISLQALQHTRHRVKITVDHTIDRRFDDITQLEKHMIALVREIRPRQIYTEACEEFTRMVEERDYEGVLRVYNKKSMITESNVASICGVKGDKEGYIAAVISILAHGGRDADAISRAIRRAFSMPQ